jgi:hypothetical protein
MHLEMALGLALALDLAVEEMEDGWFLVLVQQLERNMVQ